MVRNRRGVSLVEVVVAIAILSTTLLALSGLMWQMARQGRYAGYATARAAALETAASQAQGAAWDSLSTLVGCANDSIASFTYTQCYELTTVSNSLRTVRVIVSPASLFTLKAETLTVQRHKPLLPSPLYRP
ncbi:MAG: prepilin-type N-terminal cleavage/methylation domain-containing protein [Gemmatimonadales bacterium]